MTALGNSYSAVSGISLLGKYHVNIAALNNTDDSSKTKGTHLFGIQGLDDDIAVMADGNRTQQILQHALHKGSRQDHGAATQPQDFRQRVAHRLQK